MFWNILHLIHWITVRTSKGFVPELISFFLISIQQKHLVMTSMATRLNTENHLCLRGMIFVTTANAWVDKQHNVLPQNVQCQHVRTTKLYLANVARIPVLQVSLLDDMHRACERLSIVSYTLQVQAIAVVLTFLFTLFSVLISNFSHLKLIPHSHQS